MQILNILVRTYTSIANFEQQVDFYEHLLNEKTRLRIEPVMGKLRIAQIASMLVIGSTPDIFELVGHVRAAYLVEDLDAYIRQLPELGAEILIPCSGDDRAQFMIVKHPDGLIVEYVEHATKNPLDRMLQVSP